MHLGHWVEMRRSCRNSEPFDTPTRGFGTIGTIDPEETGFYASGRAPAEPVEDAPVLASASSVQQEPEWPLATANAVPATVRPVGQPSQETLVAANEVIIVPARPSWIRVSDESGTTLFEKVLASGEQYIVPELEKPGKTAGRKLRIALFRGRRTGVWPCGARGKGSSRMWTCQLSRSGRVTESCFPRQFRRRFMIWSGIRRRWASPNRLECSR